MKTLAASIPMGIVALAIPLFCISSCAQTISRYDEISYQQVTAVKAEALTLVDKATTSYAENKDDIAAVSLDVLKAYEYDAGRRLNETTLQQWDIILNENGNTFAGFLRLWKTKGTLPPAFVSAKRAQIGQAFNQIIDLEFGKIHD